MRERREGEKGKEVKKRKKNKVESYSTKGRIRRQGGRNLMCKESG